MQYFKGDQTELKVYSAGNKAFDSTNAALDDFYENAYDLTPFILMLYDEGRIPFSNRIPKEVFVEFIRIAYDRFPFFGSFDSLIFILREIFGAESEILLTVPDPGMLEIDINAITDQVFNFVARELSGSGGFTDSKMITDSGDYILFTGLPGIETEYELSLLFAEIIPYGIKYSFTIGFFSKGSILVEDEDGISNLVTDIGDQLIFIEVGS